MNRPVNLDWHKSSYSNNGGNACVEVLLGEEILVRDTQNRPLGHIAFPGSEWASFLADVKSERL
ncbi:DUF397 domain-containing protein [Marinactinospora thermotolerans]|uniref:DUF397 domain-containing protein n=1 Tax=Marinactinospora thermotolerans DSM 45154 TaxID=1122192 RepID=A0A1T4TDW9_9ACTN|nr:DUF397 domain-containing protein [Marinactinospora thermotolerans]SKA38616.1 protein of unknown function [Marinactinospora thermotolerans DSM 45154]